MGYEVGLYVVRIEGEDDGNIEGFSEGMDVGRRDGDEDGVMDGSNVKSGGAGGLDLFSSSGSLSCRSSSSVVVVVSDGL